MGSDDKPPNRRCGGTALEKEEGKCEAFIRRTSDDKPPNRR